MICSGWPLMLAAREILQHHTTPSFIFSNIFEKIAIGKAPGRYVRVVLLESTHQSRLACAANLRPSDCEVALLWTEDDAVVACQNGRAAAVPWGESRNIGLETLIFPVGCSFGLVALIMEFLSGPSSVYLYMPSFMQSARCFTFTKPLVAAGSRGKIVLLGTPLFSPEEQ